jgi:hypothetical protein
VRNQAHDPEEVRRLADEILGRDEFAAPDRSFVQRAVDWVLRWLERLFGGDGDPSGVETGTGGGAGGSSFFTFLLLVAAVVVVVVVVRTFWGTWGGRRRRPKDELDVDVEGHLDADAWDALARRLEAEGRWTEAMRARFGALVERLTEHGIVADVPGRTTGEYRVEVRAALPEAADAFAAAADRFDRAWYGGEEAGPDDAAGFTAAAERVLAAAGAER